MTATFPLPPPCAQAPRANRGTVAAQKPLHGVRGVSRYHGGGNMPKAVQWGCEGRYAA